MGYCGNMKRELFLICTAFVPRPGRLPYHLEQMRCMAEWPARAVTLCLLTMASDEQLAETRSAISFLRSSPLSVEFQRVDQLGDDPFMLTWAHKAVLRDRFLARIRDSHILSTLRMIYAFPGAMLPTGCAIARHSLPGYCCLGSCDMRLRMARSG